MFGLTIGGEEGVEEVFRMILADLEITLGLSGYKSLQEIQGQREKVVVHTGVPSLGTAAKL